MPTHYNRFAGANLDRLAGLADGIFAFAMTLLVLELHAPAREAVQDERGLVLALLALAPKLLVYGLSFMTLGIFWVGQQTQLNHLARGDRDLTWLHLGFLGFVTLMPFSTALMGEFITLRGALLVYWLNILALGALLFASWRLAAARQLAEADTLAAIGAAMCRRIVIAQTLYAVGAALCLIGTAWSLGFIVLVQLNYVIAPRFAGLDRI